MRQRQVHHLLIYFTYNLHHLTSYLQSFNQHIEESRTSFAERRVWEIRLQAMGMDSKELFVRKEEKTWAGRLKRVKDQCCVKVFIIDQPDVLFFITSTFNYKLYKIMDK